MSERERAMQLLEYVPDYKISYVVAYLQGMTASEEIPIKNRDHNLSGNYVNKRECHIMPDWLLVYQVERNQIH